MRKENAIKCQRVNDIIVFAEDLALFPALGERRGAHDLLHSGQQSFMRRGKLRLQSPLEQHPVRGREGVYSRSPPQGHGHSYWGSGGQGPFPSRLKV